MNRSVVPVNVSIGDNMTVTPINLIRRVSLPYTWGMGREGTVFIQKKKQFPIHTRNTYESFDVYE